MEAALTCWGVSEREEDAACPGSHRLEWTQGSCRMGKEATGLRPNTGLRREKDAARPGSNQEGSTEGELLRGGIATSLQISQGPAR